MSTDDKSGLTIRRADINDIPVLGKLFAEYRVFYNQDYENASEFLRERIVQNESVIFIAETNNQIKGFVQLYPSFTSIGISKIWILNDLYVIPSGRGQGIAGNLINHVTEFCKKTNRKKVILLTGVSNYPAQKLYEKTGFVKTDFLNYERNI